MDHLSALQHNISKLETSLDSLEHWLALMTGLVVLGLVLEYWHEIPEAVATLKQAWSWKPLLIIAGAILITVGVAGELAVQFIASAKETDLRKANDAVFSGLNSEAATARKQAGDAVERASNADERASKNEKEAARLRKLAEDERLARIKIEESVAWRRITKDQQSKIGARLKRFAGQRVRPSYNVNDTEAFTFASDIASSLQLAKWNVSEPQSILKLTEGPVPLGTHPPPVTGVVIASTPDEPSRNASDAIWRELSALGYDASTPQIDTRPMAPVVWISVEPRPQGAQGEAKLRHTAELKKQHKSDTPTQQHKN